MMCMSQVFLVACFTLARSQNADIYTQVTAEIVDPKALRGDLIKSAKYLIASFPGVRQVGYMHLPDNVWRPLVIGNVSNPMGIAADSTNSRLFVADPDSSKIYWYKLHSRSNGMLETGGKQHVAVEGYSAEWLAINGVGDLYFTGRRVGTSGVAGSDLSIYRHEAVKIATGNPHFPVEVYSRYNTGSPFPGVFAPSGIAIDSFNVYWGNKGRGKEHGSLVKGSRQDIGLQAADLTVNKMSRALDDVRGVCATGTQIFYLSPKGLFGVSSSEANEIKDESVGLINSAQVLPGNQTWDPKSIAWDGDGTIYFSDAATGTIFKAPALNARSHPIAKFVEAPGIHGVAVLAYHSSARGIGCILAVVMTLVSFAFH